MTKSAAVVYAITASPLGDIALASSEQGLCRLALPSQLALRPFPDDWQRDDDSAPHTRKQLAEYFAGKRQRFDLALDLQGTAFQQQVWQALLAIPYGQCCSYGDLAAAIKRPKAMRAVGAANGRNPLPIIVPCHRVVAANGKLSGYFGGEDVKRQLLALENAAG